MSEDNVTKNSIVPGIVLMVFDIICLIWLISMWTDHNLDFWVSYVKHEMIDVPYWISIIVSILFNVLALIFNLISEIIKYIM